MRGTFLVASLAVVGFSAGSALAAPSNWWAPYTTDANTLGLWHFDDVTGPTGTFCRFQRRRSQRNAEQLCS